MVIEVGPRLNSGVDKQIQSKNKQLQESELRITID